MTTRGTFAGVAAILAMVLATSASPQLSEPYSLALQPLGYPSRDEIAVVKSDLEATYHVTVTLLPGQPLPQEAWYAPRKRWRADRLLDYLERTTPPTFDKVLALTGSDISCTKGEHEDWGIFGYGSVGGRPAVVSTFRLKRDMPSETLFKDRLTKVALHEVGHLFGLLHCPTPGCLMEDAGGTIATVDRGGKTFCKGCEEALRRISSLNG